MTDREVLLKKYASEEEDRYLLAQVLDRMASSQRTNSVAATAFLSERQQALAGRLLEEAGSGAVFYGGYEGAARRIALFLPAWAAENPAQYAPLKYIRATWAAQAHVKLTHRDFLGALMAVGINRETVGDILVGELYCDFIVTDKIAPWVLQNLLSAGRASLSLREIQPEELSIAMQEFKRIHDTVASLRLDSVVASGFSLSREKAATLVRGGTVILNNLPCEKPDKPVAEGDVIAARGFGKFRVTSAGHLTRKGRISLEIDQYI